MQNRNKLGETMVNIEPNSNCQHHLSSPARYLQNMFPGVDIFQ
jgi:hypothetical protein